MTLLHYLSYAGAIATFLFVTLSLGESPRHASGTSPNLDFPDLQRADCCGSPS